MVATIKAGDKVWVRTGSKRHYGICTGVGPDGAPWFVHNTRHSGVVHTTRKGFAGNRAIVVEQRAGRAGAANDVAAAMLLCGMDYDLLRFNCEHVVNLAANGERTSSQLQAGVSVALLGALAAWVANENGSYVDSYGYRRAANGQFEGGVRNFVYG